MVLTDRVTRHRPRSAAVSAALATALAVVLASCSTDRSSSDFFAPGGVGIPVVDAVLMVGQYFPDVYLSRTLRPDETFSWNKAGISATRLRIVGGGQAIVYAAVMSQPGRHVPPPPGAIVQPATTYRLTAELPDGRVLKATTTTPDSIRVRDWVLLNDAGTDVVQQLIPSADDSVYTEPANQLTYSEGLLEVRLQAAPAPGYQVGLLSLDLDSPLLIDTSFLDPSVIDNFTRLNQSPPFVTTDARIRLPWFAIYYQGRYKLRVFAMDRNWFDLARSDPALGSGGFGFGGEAGDSFNRPIFHVEGGIGLFGSMSADSVGFYVHAP